MQNESTYRRQILVDLVTGMDPADLLALPGVEAALAAGLKDEIDAVEQYEWEVASGAYAGYHPDEMPPNPRFGA